jgi:hypothetical protein
MNFNMLIMLFFTIDTLLFLLLISIVLLNSGGCLIASI